MSAPVTNPHVSICNKPPSLKFRVFMFGFKKSKTKSHCGSFRCVLHGVACIVSGFGDEYAEESDEDDVEEGRSREKQRNIPRLRVVCKHLRKSRSASAVRVVSCPQLVVFYGFFHDTISVGFALFPICIPFLRWRHNDGNGPTSTGNRSSNSNRAPSSKGGRGREKVKSD